MSQNSKSKIDPEMYRVEIAKITAEDGSTLFHAKVKEFPHVETFGDSFDEAYRLALDSISSLIELANEMGKEFPLPQESQRPVQEESEYSGRVTLRMPKRMHAVLARHAEDEGVSLNHYFVSILAFAAAKPSLIFAQHSNNVEVETAHSIARKSGVSKAVLSSEHIQSKWQVFNEIKEFDAISDQLEVAFFCIDSSKDEVTATSEPVQKERLDFTKVGVYSARSLVYEDTSRLLELGIPSASEKTFYKKEKKISIVK